jgi:hypothetical protein
MRKLLLGLAVLPFLAGVTLAQEPMRLTSQQMDKVNAGWDLLEFDFSNTSGTAISIYQNPHVVGGNNITCPSCYLLINSNAFSVASFFGHP